MFTVIVRSAYFLCVGYFLHWIFSHFSFSHQCFSLFVFKIEYCLYLYSSDAQLCQSCRCHFSSFVDFCEFGAIWFTNEESIVICGL